MSNKTLAPLLLAIVALSTQLAGCEAVKGIFKAGLWTGVILVAIVAGLLFAVVNRARRA